MNVFIVYCHPSSNSFTFAIKEAFIKGISESGHSFTVSDLYSMNFNPVFTESEYLREAFYDNTKEIPSDVLVEQEKINNADFIVFIYPDFWTEAPSLLVGWFQRVWTYGFAYGNNPNMKLLEKALFLVTMGGSLKDDIRAKQVEAMKTVMIGDRINKRAKASEMIVFDEMTRGYGNDGRRNDNIEKFVEQAYQLGRRICMQNQPHIEIKTERLFLRTPTEADAAAVKDFSDGEFETEKDALEWIRWVNDRTEKTRYMFYIWLTQTNQLIGRVYFHSKPELNHEVEIGYGIAEEHRNNGYATEAAKAVVQFAFEQAGQEVLSAIVKPENTPSLCVIEKLGFVSHGTRTVLDNGEECEFNYYKLYSSI